MVAALGATLRYEAPKDVLVVLVVASAATEGFILVVTVIRSGLLRKFKLCLKRFYSGSTSFSLELQKQNCEGYVEGMKKNGNDCEDLLAEVAQKLPLCGGMRNL